MISKKFILTLFFSFPIFWLLFYLSPKYLLPAECFLDNFIYIDNLIKHKFYHYDAFSTYNFDDSNNLIFNFIVASISYTFKLSVYNSIIVINSISLLLSFFTLAKTVNSRFSEVNFFLMLALLSCVQIWAALLGSDVLFCGLLYLLVLSSFWNKRYTFLLIYSSVLVAIKIDHILYVLPLILSSYIDVKELKDRLKVKFYAIRISKTIVYFVIPILIFYSYRIIYFGKALPHQFKDSMYIENNKLLIFDKSSLYFGLHYVRYFLLPIILGLLFYFIKQRKKINIKYYAILFGFVIFPFLRQATIPQTENIAYQNYYIIFLGLIVLVFIFIRDFRSLSQKFFLGIYFIFYAIPQTHTFAINTLQHYNNNIYRIANDLKQFQHQKIISYYDNFISYQTKWQTIFANNRHVPKRFSINNNIDSLIILDAHIILHQSNIVDKKWNKMYNTFLVPSNTRLYIKEQKPENSIDYIFYYLREKYDRNKFNYISISIKKKGLYYKEIENILIKNGAYEKKNK